jgi:hypothetical protein
MPGPGLNGVGANENVAAARVPQKRRKRGRVPIDALAHEGLFLILTNLRCASAPSLFELFFRKKGVKWRTAMRRLHDLVDAGYLVHHRLASARCVYHLTPKSLALTPALQVRAHASLDERPPERQAVYGWLRSAFYARKTAEGWNVGNDGPALHALRRFHIDDLMAQLAKGPRGRERDDLQSRLAFARKAPALAVSPEEIAGAPRWRCRDCGRMGKGEHRDENGIRCPLGNYRAMPVAPLDIAWRTRGNAYEIIVLFIDNPSLPLADQLESLRHLCFWRRVPVIVRSTDPRTRFDREKGRVGERGDRHRELDRAFEKDFAERVRVLDDAAELHAYVVGRGRRVNADERARILDADFAAME